MTSTQTHTTQPTPFEEQLKEYFPDLYTLHVLSKYDKNYYKLIDAITKAVNENKYGTIRILYQNGKINYLFFEENLTAQK